jgi:hypothetical protein
MDTLLEPVVTHPVLGCVAEIHRALGEAQASSATYLSVAEKRTVLIELSREVERARGLLLQVMAASDDVALDDGARNVADWLAARTRADYGPRHRDEVLAESLDRRWGRVAQALRDGGVNTGQAEAIVRSLDALGTDVDHDLLVKAEADLLEQAAFFGPRALRVMGRKVLEVIALASTRTTSAADWRPRNAAPPNAPTWCSASAATGAPIC